MTWRIHLTAQAVNHLQILPGKNPVLAAWSRPDRVEYYDLDSGTKLGDDSIPPAPNGDRSSDDWLQFVSALKGPDDNTYLPVIQSESTTIYILHHLPAHGRPQTGGIQNWYPICFGS